MVDTHYAPARLWAPRESDNIDFTWLVEAFRRHASIFLIIFGATIGLVVMFMLLYPPDYTAKARIVVNERTLSAGPERSKPVVSSLPFDSAAIDTETQVITSKRVAQRVVQILHLEQDPEFTGDHVSLQQSVANFFVMIFHKLPQAQADERVVNAVLGHVAANRYLDTNAIDILVKDKDPHKAQTLANAFAQAYLDDQVATKMAQNRQAATGLLSQLESMRQDAANDSAKVYAYRISHNLLSVGAQTLTEQEISVYDQAVASAKAEAAADEASLRTAQEQLLHGSNGEDVGGALISPVVRDLRTQRAELTGKLAFLEAHYGPKYPDLAQARRAVSNIDLEIQSEILRTISNLAAKAKISEKRLASLQSTLGATKNALAENNAAEAGLQNLSQLATASQVIYEAYLQRFKESVAQLQSLTPDAEILSAASLPLQPSMPVFWLFMTLGVVVGIMLGAAAVLVAALVETRISTVQDVEYRLGRRFLGAVPLLSSAMRGSALSPLDFIVANRLSPFSESLRGLLTSISLTSTTAGLGVVVVTSAQPEDGKSTIAGGLARTAALQGIPTILIDGDGRSRGRALARDFAIEDRGAGLVAVLRGEVSLADAIRPDKDSGAVILPMSEDSSAADELMAGPAMEALLATLREQFDAIIIDAPSIPIAVSRALAAKADLSLIVMNWRARAEDGLFAALRLPPFENGAPVGVALNRIDMARQARFGFGRPVGGPKSLRDQYA